MSARQHAVAIDAGSTGTRLHVVAWRPGAQGPVLVEVHPNWTRKVQPGLSSQSPREGAASLAPLLRFAASIVPTSTQHRTPLLLFGTAGVRLLAAPQQAALYSAARAACAASGFLSVGSSFRTLEGREEGEAGLLALGWLGGSWLSGAAPRDLGLIDLGGGSAQIAFPLSASTELRAAEHALHGSVPLPGSLPSGGSLISRSLLGYGNRAALLRTEALLTADSEALRTAGELAASTAHVRHPCFHRGWAYSSRGVRFEGSSDPHRCAALVRRLFAADGPPPRFERPPLPPAHVRFYAVSAAFFIANFLHSQQPIAGMPAPALRDVRSAAEAHCAQEWEAVQRRARDNYTTEEKLPMRCFDATYLLALLVRAWVRVRAYLLTLLVRARPAPPTCWCCCPPPAPHT